MDQIPNKSRYSFLWATITILCIFTGLSAVYLNPLNQDVGLMISLAERYLDGDRLYVDIFEINPPLFVYVAIPIIAIAKAFSIPTIDSWLIFCFLLICISVCLCWFILSRLSSLSGLDSKRVVIIYILLAFLHMVGGEFGQREHIMLILFLPYVLLTTVRASGRSAGLTLCLTVGALGGLGIAYKPFFVLPWMGLEGYLWLVRRQGGFWRRPESLTLFCMQITYAAVVLACMPEYLAFIKHVAGCYGLLNASMYTQLWQMRFAYPVTLLALLMFFLTRPSPEDSESRRILMIATLCFIGVAFVQRKGFGYHFYPAAGTGLVLLVIVILGKAKDIDWGPILRPRILSLELLLGSIALFASIFYMVEAQRSSARFNQSEIGRAIEYLKAHGQNKSAVIVTDDLHPFWPLVNYNNIRVKGRFYNSFVFNACSKAQADGANCTTLPREERDNLEKWENAVWIDDFLKYHPQLVLVKGEDEAHRGIDILKHYLSDPRLKKVWSNYALVARYDYIYIYALRDSFIRMDSKAIDNDGDQPPQTGDKSKI